jgi:alkanesulfonate monooxygenase SsuD/methylene tetrahydromethanopterin reductase-like flavin-dependent oxidoreductase (luciferase family)
MEQRTVRLGFAVPQFGPHAGPDAILEVARKAEELGYDSLWVAERLLYPRNPKAPYPGTADGSLPLAYRRSLDPLAILAYLAVATSRVRIGTFINLTFHNPVVLARELSTIDVLSDGRLDVGLGGGSVIEPPSLAVHTSLLRKPPEQALVCSKCCSSTALQTAVETALFC